MPHLSVCRRMSEYSTIHATALQVNRPHLPRGSETKSRLGSRDKIAIESDADLPVEKVEQDYDAFAITHALEQPKATCKHAILDPNFSAGRKFWTFLQSNQATFIFLSA